MSDYLRFISRPLISARGHSLAPREDPGAVETFGTAEPSLVRPKVDVEGAEPAVLNGMKKLIEVNKNIAMIIEFYPKAIKRFGVSPVQFLNDLKNFGFTLYAIPETPETEPKEIHVENFSALARGEGISKLVNILCIKIKKS